MVWSCAAFETIDFEKVKTVAVIDKLTEHDCYKDNEGMNPDDELRTTAPFWYSQAKYLKKTEENLQMSVRPLRG